MKLRIPVILGLLLFLAASLAFGEPRYIVRALPETAAPIARRHALTVLDRLDVPGRGHAILLVGDPTARPPEDVVPALRSDPGVISIELDSAVNLPELNQSTVAILDGISADRSTTGFYGDGVWSQYVAQSATSIIQLAAAQSSYTTGAGVVAVIDTGVDPTHPVLADILVPGYDFTRNLPGLGSELLDVSPEIQAALAQSAESIANKQATILNQSTVAILDQSTVAILDGNLPPAFGHGTMIAGLIHLASPTAKVMSLKTFTSSGSATLYNVVRAVYFAVDHGARTINMSFSMDKPSNELDSAIAYANANRAVCVSSVGNAGVQTTVYPAAWKKVIGTASTTNTDARSSFSNYGSTIVSVAAPGEGLITVYPGKNYAAVWGTSFSAALVSGGGALLRGLDPRISQDQATTALSQAAYLGPDLGAGRIDLYLACRYWANAKGLF